jgi:hypothetical protein
VSPVLMAPEERPAMISTWLSASIAVFASRPAQSTPSSKVPITKTQQSTMSSSSSANKSCLPTETGGSHNWLATSSPRSASSDSFISNHINDHLSVAKTRALS